MNSYRKFWNNQSACWAVLLCGFSLFPQFACAQSGGSDTEPFTQFSPKAEKVDAQGQFDFGQAFAPGNHGSGTATNFEEAVKEYRLGAEQHVAECQYNLGLCYASGLGVEKDAVEAAKWFHKAAEQNHVRAQLFLGACYVKGQGVTTDFVEAITWFRKAAEQGNAPAQNALGFCYASGQGVAKDAIEAVKWYREAAAQEDAQAQYNLGWCYYNGEGVNLDYVEAVRWFRKATDQDYAPAQFQLGLCFYTGRGVEKDIAEAYAWWSAAASTDTLAAQALDTLAHEMSPEQKAAGLRRAAELRTQIEARRPSAEMMILRRAAATGDRSAQSHLGVCYAFGLGTTTNLAEAIKWWRQAARQDDALAQFSLGHCYSFGQGIEQDYAEAVNWYRRAAGKNYAEADYALGVCYDKGLGVGKDDAEAVKWFRKAAEQNHAEAELNLGVAYVTGQGVAKDEVEAYKWWLLAGAQGLELARQNSVRLEHQLTPQQRSEGQKRAAEFKPPEVASVGGDLDAVEGNLSADLLARAKSGNAQAQNELGEAFHTGTQGAGRNDVEAVKWFRLAAGQNYAAAQSNLGRCYEFGDGVAKYEVEAFKWYLLAAAQGDKKAKNNVTILELTLSDEQIAEGKQRAQAWLEQLKTNSPGHASEVISSSPKSQ